MKQQPLIDSDPPMTNERYQAVAKQAREAKQTWEVSIVEIEHLAACLNEQVLRLNGVLHEVQPLPDHKTCLVIWYRWG